MGLDVVLPRPSALDLVLGDPEGPVDGTGLPRPEYPSPVGDDRLRRAVALDRGIEDREVGGEVLSAGEGAREHGPRVVVQHRDHVGSAAELVALKRLV